MRWRTTTVSFAPLQGVLRRERHEQQDQPDKRRHGAAARIEMSGHGEQQVVEHPRVGQIAQRDAEAGHDSDGAQQFHDRDVRNEIGRIAERGKGLAHSMEASRARFDGDEDRGDRT